MATRLSDIIDTNVFDDLPAENTPEKTVFFQSGIVTASSALDSYATQPGTIIEMPFWKDLGNDEPNVSGDDPSMTATPKKAVQAKQMARKAMLNQGWSSADLAAELVMGAKPMQHVRNRVDAYWVRQWQRRLVAATLGVLADNVGSNSGDMVADFAIEDGNNALEANLFSRTAFTTGAFTLGDCFENTGAVVMHSTVYSRLVNNNGIEFIPDSDGRLTIPMYMGRRVLVDDQSPVIAGTTSGFKYITTLFGAGAFGYGNGSPETPSEVDRKADGGNGAGIETLWSRKSWLLHPFGYTFNSTTVASESASLAELKLAANWTRVIDRKNVPVCFIITNG